MRFDTYIINTLFATISGLLIVFYIKMIGIHYETKKCTLFFIFFGVVNGILSTTLSSLGSLISTVKPLILFIISILLIKFILQCSLKDSIVAFLINMVGMGIGNSIAMLIPGLIFGGDIMNKLITLPYLYFLTNIISAAIALLFEYIFIIAFRFIKHIKNNTEFVLILVFTFVIISANVGLYYYVKVFNFTAFLTISLMSIAYSSYIIFNSAIIYKKELQKIEQEQQAFYNKSLEDTLFSLRRFKHDWVNNLNVLNAMASIGKYNDLKNYINEISQYIQETNTAIFNIKNAGLFGIISSKLNAAREQGLNVNLSCLGEISIIPDIKTSELCEIVGIFLDNAIDEAKKTGEHIEINLSNLQESIEIGVKNKCQNDINISKLGSFTTKGEGHGSGLRIVDNIISKYKNVKNLRNYEAEGKMFEQLLIIEKGL